MAFERQIIKPRLEPDVVFRPHNGHFWITASEALADSGMLFDHCRCYLDARNQLVREKFLAVVQDMVIGGQPS